jgi:amino acid transporter
VTASWFSLHGIGGKGSLAAGFLITVFMYSGWDGTIYVNEEVRHRSRNPGKAAIAAVVITGALFVLAQTGLQGVVPPAKLQQNSAAGLVYLGTVLGGSSGGRAATIALALSVIAATGAGILLTARILYGMASRRVLPDFLGNVSGRFKTPVAATLLSGLVLIVLAWFYLLSTSIASAFSDVINITGLLYASFYVLTALAAIVYYRRRIISDAKELLTLGVLPLGAIAFLVWVIVKTISAAPPVQNESLGGVVAAGFVLMLAARFGLRSSFFQVPRESDHSRH